MKLFTQLFALVTKHKLAFWSCLGLTVAVWLRRTDSWATEEVWGFVGVGGWKEENIYIFRASGREPAWGKEMFWRAQDLVEYVMNSIKIFFQ